MSKGETSNILPPTKIEETVLAFDDSSDDLPEIKNMEELVLIINDSNKLAYNSHKKIIKVNYSKEEQINSLSDELMDLELSEEMYVPVKHSIFAKFSQNEKNAFLSSNKVNDDFDAYDHTHKEEYLIDEFEYLTKEITENNPKEDVTIFENKKLVVDFDNNSFAMKLMSDNSKLFKN